MHKFEEAARLAERAEMAKTIEALSEEPEQIRVSLYTTSGSLDVYVQKGSQFMAGLLSAIKVVASGDKANISTSLDSVMAELANDVSVVKSTSSEVKVK